MLNGRRGSGCELEVQLKSQGFTNLERRGLFYYVWTPCWCQGSMGPWNASFRVVLLCLIIRIPVLLHHMDLRPHHMWVLGVIDYMNVGQLHV